MSQATILPDHSPIESRNFTVFNNPLWLSVGYRFCLAALILLAYCYITRKRLNFLLRDHLFMALQGITLYGLCYFGSYFATAYMTSGLVAVVFIDVLNINAILTHLTPAFKSQNGHFDR